MAPNTIFHNIFQVNPGEIVSVDSNGHITKDSFEDFDSEDEKELTAETENMIKLATEFYDREIALYEE